MFISQLKAKIDAYDKFYEFRINGLKALFVLELMFLFNFIYTVSNPYFYFFYVPLTAFAAELAGNTLKEKYFLLFFTLMGTTLAIFLFGVLSEYKALLVFFVFFFSLAIYYIAIYKIKGMFVAAPLILSLASYSLIYGNSNSNFYIALNHALQTIVATIIILVGLYMFPKTYYLTIWRRAFHDVLVNLEAITARICKEDVKTIPIFSGIIMMERHSRMLSKQMRCYSILKITLLSFELIMSMSYLITFQKQIKIQYIVVLHKYLLALSEVCLKQLPVNIAAHELAVMNETHELRTLYQIILSWNYLCLDQ